jgi:prolyl oligopeptidase
VIYPATRKELTTDSLAGVVFPDPYRWLEQDSPEVRAWQQDQATLAADHVASWPHFTWVRDTVRRLSVDRQSNPPTAAGGSWFRLAADDGTHIAVLADSPLGKGRVLFDPRNENPDRPPVVSWIRPSPNGAQLALGVCTDGSERNSIRVVDVATGTLLVDVPNQVLMDNWTGGAHWLLDSSGFYFTALLGDAQAFAQEVFLHLLATDTSSATTSLVEVPWTATNEYRAVTVSQCGKWAVALERLMRPLPVAVLDLTVVGEAWRPFVTDVSGIVAGHVVGTELLAVTDVDAPRGRLVAIALDAEDPNDTSTWRTVLAESVDVLRTVTPVAGYLYLAGYHDTYARVQILDSTGALVGEVPLPGRGALTELPFPMMNLLAPHPSDDFVFTYSSLDTTWAIYRHTPGQPDVEPLAGPGLQLEGVVIDDLWARSKDGTLVPFHVLRKKGLPSGHPVPALLAAYGGYNAPYLPQFPGGMAAFVEGGGAYIHVHLRGGAEFGRLWWEGGRLTMKQNCYDDLYAVAELIHAEAISSPEQLALVGGSNGGLMAGVALLQRPDLWAAAIPRVPFLDLIGACRESYGRMAVALELGDPDDPADVQRLATISPYHLVTEGQACPAVYVEAGDTDPRCPPWHARKFAARLQAAQSGPEPVLLRVWENVGHGWATATDIALEQATAWLAFAMMHTGLVPPR